jgi:hypothetical protein
MHILFIFLLTIVEPPGKPIANDRPNDAGKNITIQWILSSQDDEIDGYEIYRSQNDGPFEMVGSIPKGNSSFTDSTQDGITYRYQIAAIKDGTIVAQSEISEEVTSSGQWFHTNRINILIGLIVYSAILLWFIYHARKGKEMYIRKISGLDH